MTTLKDNWSVKGSDTPGLIVRHYETLNDALRAAIKSGQRVYLHDEHCTTDNQELGPRCPCHPVLIRTDRQSL